MGCRAMESASTTEYIYNKKIVTNEKATEIGNGNESSNLDNAIKPKSIKWGKIAVNGMSKRIHGIFMSS